VSRHAVFRGGDNGNDDNGRLYCIGGGDWTVPLNGNVYNYVQIYQP
jgi:hypothetical protein